MQTVLRQVSIKIAVSRNKYMFFKMLWVFFVFCFFPLVEKNSNLKKNLKNFKKKKKSNFSFYTMEFIFHFKSGMTWKSNLLREPITSSV